MMGQHGFDATAYTQTDSPRGNTKPGKSDTYDCFVACLQIKFSELEMTDLGLYIGVLLFIVCYLACNIIDYFPLSRRSSC